MKKLLPALLLMFSLFANAQTDTVTIEKTKTITGSVLKLYTDRIIMADAYGNEFMIYHDRISSFNIRQRTKHGDMWGIEYFSDPSLLKKGVFEFKDTKAYLKDAGAYGITASSLLIGGGIISGIGAAVKNSATVTNGVYTQANGTGNSLMIVGSALGTLGTALLVPAFVQLFKAGKTKTYRIP